MKVIKSIMAKKPGNSIVNGLTTANMGKPDFNLCTLQHEAYLNAFRALDVEVICLDADEEFADSTFIEDTAIVTPNGVVITRPGAESRFGEIVNVKNSFGEHFPDIPMKEISRGFLDGGDVLNCFNHYYIGISSRTNHQGALELKDKLSDFGCTASLIDIRGDEDDGSLHLKTSVSMLFQGDGFASFLMTEDFFYQYGGLMMRDYMERKDFQKPCRVVVCEEGDEYCANSLFVNGKILFPKGFENTKMKMIETGGFLEDQFVELETSEFQKVDGGLSCLSLRCEF